MKRLLQRLTRDCHAHPSPCHSSTFLALAQVRRPTRAAPTALYCRGGATVHMACQPCSSHPDHAGVSIRRCQPLSHSIGPVRHRELAPVVALGREGVRSKCWHLIMTGGRAMMPSQTAAADAAGDDSAMAGLNGPAVDVWLICDQHEGHFHKADRPSMHLEPEGSQTTWKVTLMCDQGTAKAQHTCRCCEWW